MSDKKLLEEGTVRRFMELANIKPLNTIAEGKKKKEGLKEKEEKPAKGMKPAAGGRPGASGMDPATAAKAKAGKKGAAVEESIEESIEETVEENFIGEAEGEEAGGEMADMGADMGDMGGDMGGGEEGGDSKKPAVQKIIDGLNELLADSGLEVDMEKEGGGGEGEEAGGEAGEEGMLEAYGKKKMEEKKPSAEEEGVYESLNLEVEDDEALAEELTRRVAARLVAEMKKGGGKWGAPPKAAKKPTGHGASKKAFGTKSKGH